MREVSCAVVRGREPGFVHSVNNQAWGALCRNERARLPVYLTDQNKKRRLWGINGENRCSRRPPRPRLRWTRKRRSYSGRLIPRRPYLRSIWSARWPKRNKIASPGTEGTGSRRTKRTGSFPRNWRCRSRQATHRQRPNLEAASLDPRPRVPEAKADKITGKPKLRT